MACLLPSYSTSIASRDLYRPIIRLPRLLKLYGASNSLRSGASLFSAGSIGALLPSGPLLYILRCIYVSYALCLRVAR